MEKEQKQKTKNEKQNKTNEAYLKLTKAMRLRKTTNGLSDQKWKIFK